MELTFKIVLDKRHLKRNETYPLKLRIFQNRVFKEHSLNIDLPEKDWDINMQMVLPSCENAIGVNSKLATIKAKVQKFIFLNEGSENSATPTTIITHLKGKSSSSIVISQPDILKYGREHIAKLRVTGNIGNSIAYSCAINKLQGYVKTELLSFESIDYKFLESFNFSLLKEGIKINSISLYLRAIRALFNKAIKDGTLEAKYYPFTGFKIKSERTISRALSKAEISQILRIELPINSTIWHHRNLFALSYCLIGMNFSDLLTLTKENFVEDRIIFRRKKTHKIYSIKIQAKVKGIFEHYCKKLPDCNKKFLLPFVKNKNNPVVLKNDILQAIKNTNDYLRKIASLCGINKNVTTYYARYTWANVAREEGFSKDMIAEALGHQYGNKVTGIYLDNYDNEILDEMNYKVISSVID